MTMHFSNWDRRDFRKALDEVVHPSVNVSQPGQLKGREEPLRALRDCFETAGSQAFIWGSRGVGKTSLAHTSCEKYPENVLKVSAVACEPESSVDSLLTDIVRDVVRDGRVDLRSKEFEASLSAMGLANLGAKLSSADYKIESPSVNFTADLLSTICAYKISMGICPVIIIDEFERLANLDVKRHFTDLIKQMSVKSSRVKLVFCGVATSLSELLGQHGSAERYVQQIELRPLSADALMEIIADVERRFEVRFSRGQQIRMCQISEGFAHFTHLMLKNILLRAYEGKVTEVAIPDWVYKEGIKASIAQVSDRLRRRYEGATQKGSDAFIEVLWAAAHGPLFRNQFKTIQSNYQHIMKRRPEDRPTLDEQKLRNCLNSLTQASHTAVLQKFPSGWYEFDDPMVRSFTRLVAEKEGIELGQHHFKD